MSEAAALRCTPSPNCALISITEPNRTAELINPHAWGALLRIRFADAEYDLDTFRLLAERGQHFDPAKKGFPVKDHANQIRDFLTSLAANPELVEIIVHCKAGQRRSAAVAKYAAECFSLEFDHGYAGYNRTVYALLKSPAALDVPNARVVTWLDRIVALFRA